MRKLLMGVALIVGLGPVSTAWAGEACTPMLMPVVQLKQFARGFGYVRGGFHSGVDLTAPYGSPVRAADTGVVTFIGSFYGYGNMIDIMDASGLVTRYGHLSSFAHGLRLGSLVSTGSWIGAIGTSGQAHGPHLHFEVRIHDVAVDPAPYLALKPCIVGPGTPVEEARAPDAPVPRHPH